MSTYSDFNALGWLGNQYWIYNVPGNYSGTAEGDILGATSGDTFTIIPRDGGYPLITASNGLKYRWRAGTYNIINQVPSYSTQDGPRAIILLDNAPLEHEDGTQVSDFNTPAFAGVPGASAGYLNAPGYAGLVDSPLRFQSRNAPTTVTLYETETSSGGAGFTKKLHRTAAPTDTPDASTVIATGNGPWTDSPPTDDLFYYFLEYYDNFNTGSRAKTSNICAASRTGTALPTMPAAKSAAPQKLAIITAGNSNTFLGAYKDTVSFLTGIDARYDVTYTNCGVGGKRAINFVDDPTLYQPVLDAIAAALAAGRIPVIIQGFGTNEGVLDRLEARQYGMNSQLLASTLLNAGAKYVLLLGPAYSIPRRFNQSPNAILALLLQYQQELAGIASANDHIFYVPGLYRFIADHQDLISDGAHFGNVTDIGSRLAAAAIATDVPPVGSGSGGSDLTPEQIAAAVRTELAPELGRIDANITSRSSHSAIDVWNALTSGGGATGSFGKRIIDFLTGDAFARLGAPTGASVSVDIASIKAKTQNLPASPASTADVQVTVNPVINPTVLSGASITALTNSLVTALVEGIRKMPLFQRMSSKLGTGGGTRTKQGNVTTDTNRREDGGTTAFAGNEQTGVTTVTDTPGTGSNWTPGPTGQGSGGTGSTGGGN